MFEMDPEARAWGVTPVENRFLLEYLPAAKGDYVKVYLWGLFACGQPKPEYGLEEMAQELFLTVPEIEAALRYWERRGLVTRLSENPPQYRFHSPGQRQQMPPVAGEVDMEYVSFAEAVYAAFGDRRKVSPSEISLAWEWVQDVGLPPEAVLMLLHHCMTQKGPHFSFRAAEKLAVSMKEAGVRSPEDAESFLQHNQTVHDGARKVLSRMGKRRLPSDDELALYEKWVREWGFEPQAILDACRETTSGDPSFKYLDGILKGIRSRSAARTGAQVAQQLEREQGEKNSAQEVFQRLGVKSLSAPAAAREYAALLEIQPHGVLLLAADECRRKGWNLEEMHWLLERWKSKGLENEQAVQEYLNKRKGLEGLLREVFEACGHRGNPTAADLILYNKWHDWGYDLSMVCAAAEQARNAEGSKIPYLDKVLQAWHEAGITDLSQVQARPRPAAPARGKTVSAQQYGQRQYTEEELLAVSDDLIEEARKQRG